MYVYFWHTKIYSQRNLKNCPNWPNSENGLKFSYARKNPIFLPKDMSYSVQTLFRLRIQFYKSLSLNYLISNYLILKLFSVCSQLQFPSGVCNIGFVVFCLPFPWLTAKFHTTVVLCSFLRYNYYNLFCEYITLEDSEQKKYSCKFLQKSIVKKQGKIKFFSWR